jgi:PDZ domain-containing secreted protein
VRSEFWMESENADWHRSEGGNPLNVTYKVAFVIALMLGISFPVSAQSQKLQFPSYKGAVIGAAVGVGAGVAVLVLYLTLRNPAITGCMQSADGAFSLTDDKDHLSYALVDETSGLKAGERVKLKGKKKKDKQGKLSFHVTKVKKDYGSCQS